MKIFLSAVSGHFKTCREALRSDLSAVGAQVVAQEDFQQHGASLPEKIERYIASATLPWLGAIVRAEEKIRSRRMEYGVGEQNSVESYRRVLVTGHHGHGSSASRRRSFCDRLVAGSRTS